MFEGFKFLFGPDGWVPGWFPGWLSRLVPGTFDSDSWRWAASWWVVVTTVVVVIYVIAYLLHHAGGFVGLFGLAWGFLVSFHFCRSELALVGLIRLLALTKRPCSASRPCRSGRHSWKNMPTTRPDATSVASGLPGAVQCS